MSALEIHKRAKAPYMKWNAPRYYDHPDGEDLMGKLSFVLKHTAAIGIIGGTVYSDRDRNLNMVGKLMRIGKFFAPSVAMGFTFTCVTYCCTVYRKKDDGLNHALGGMAAGLILGPALGKPVYSRVGALLVGIMTCFTKNIYMNGYDISGNVSRRYHNTYYKRVLDFSTVPEIKGNWTRDP